jgi:hypothetical protein
VLTQIVLVAVFVTTVSAHKRSFRIDKIFMAYSFVTYNFLMAGFWEHLCVAWRKGEKRDVSSQKLEN